MHFQQCNKIIIVQFTQLDILIFAEYSAPLHLHVMHNTLITTRPCCIYIHCMFLSSHISVGKKAVNGKMVNVLHLLLPES